MNVNVGVDVSVDMDGEREDRYLRRFYGDLLLLKWASLSILSPPVVA